MEPDYKYWAFISYSHEDKSWGDWLHAALETYRVPRRLVGRPGRDGALPKRLYPVFRDREELPSSSDLSNNINEALRRSRHLVVICSPKSAVSRWVNEEIKSYKRLGRDDRILALIVDGEPNASDKPESGKLECFPPALRHQVGPDGELLPERVEAIAADLRPGKDGKANARLKLLAGLLGVAYDELRQRERQRRRRRQLQLAAAVLFAAVAGLGLWYTLARHAAGLRDADLGRDALQNGNPVAAAVYLDAAWHLGVRTKTVELMLREAVRPLTIRGIPLENHPALALNSALSPDGKQIASVEQGLLAYVWDTATGARRQLPPLHAEAVSYDPTGKMLVIVGVNGAENFFDAQSLASVGSLTLDNKKGLCIPYYVPGGKAILYGCGGGRAFLYDPAAKKVTAHIDTPPGYWSETPVFRPDGAQLLVRQFQPTRGGSDALVAYSVPDGRLQFRLLQTRYPENFADLVANGNGQPLFGYTDGGKTVYQYGTGQVGFWRASDGGFIKTLPHAPWGGANPGTNLVITKTKEDEVEIRDEHNEVQGRVREKGETFKTVSYLSPDGAYLATLNSHAIMKVWDAGAGDALFAAYVPDAYSLQLSPQENYVLSRSLDGAAIWRHLPKTELERDWLLPRGVRSAAFAHDGHHLFVGLDDETGRLLDADRPYDPPSVTYAKPKTGSRLEKLLADYDQQNHISIPLQNPEFSADDSRLLTVTPWDAYVWDVKTGALVMTLRLPMDQFGRLPRPDAVRLSADGRRLFVALDRLQSWDVTTGKLKATFGQDARHYSNIALSGDGRRLCAATDAGVELWSLEDARLLGHLGPKQTVIFCAFDPDGRHMVVEYEDGSGRVLDASGGDGLPLPLGETEHNMYLAGFDAPGGRLAIFSKDELGVWDAAKGRRVSGIDAQQFKSRAVRLSPDGAFLAGQGSDGRLALWDADDGRLLLRLTEAPEQDGNPVLAFDAAGNRLLSGYPDGSLQLWDLGHAPFDEVRAAAWIRCRVPWRLSGEQLVAAVPDEAACPR